MGFRLALSKINKKKTVLSIYQKNNLVDVRIDNLLKTGMAQSK